MGLVNRVIRHQPACLGHCNGEGFIVFRENFNLKATNFHFALYFTSIRNEVEGCERAMVGQQKCAELALASRAQDTPRHRVSNQKARTLPNINHENAMHTAQTSLPEPDASPRAPHLHREPKCIPVCAAPASAARRCRRTAAARRCTMCRR